MDSSTIIFIATLAVAFVFLRWLITPIPNSHELERSVNQYQQHQEQEPIRRRRQVTDSMIEVVQAIAPTLTRDQIIMDLNQTGSVELTIDRYMELGGLPLPPSSSANTATTTSPVANDSATTTSNNVSTGNASTTQKKPNNVKKSSISLLEKYNIDPDSASTSSFSNKSDLTLQERKVKMVLEARSRYQESVKKEI
ncbi:hypothetical protein DFJ63DRAFT_52247 [Scheffersomyces coipomensis]|uniref:uncharacterized protein n=1 Tax=Scheffersomyces coipomensis TaxID=1788519 RepID=UPI00315D277B